MTVIRIILKNRVLRITRTVPVFTVDRASPVFLARRAGCTDFENGSDSTLGLSGSPLLSTRCKRFHVSSDQSIKKRVLYWFDAAVGQLCVRPSFASRSAVPGDCIAD